MAFLCGYFLPWQILWDHENKRPVGEDEAVEKVLNLFQVRACLLACSTCSHGGLFAYSHIVIDHDLDFGLSVSFSGRGDKCV